MISFIIFALNSANACYMMLSSHRVLPRDGLNTVIEFQTHFAKNIAACNNVSVCVTVQCYDGQGIVGFSEKMLSDLVRRADAKTTMERGSNAVYRIKTEYFIKSDLHGKFSERLKFISKRHLAVLISVPFNHMVLHIS
jgi:hypothetical protein